MIFKPFLVVCSLRERDEILSCSWTRKYPKKPSPSRVVFNDALRCSDYAGAHKTHVCLRFYKTSDDKRSNSCSLHPENLARLGSLKGQWSFVVNLALFLAFKKSQNKNQ
jgi:hypothetical protein